jgi:hypothetical protein
METKDKVLVIQSNIEALRREINLRIESQNSIGRLVLAGLAAVVVLKADIQIGRFLPVVPIVGMLITAFWFTETLFVFRTGRWIASMEAQINTLAGSDILQYESTLWQQRKATLWGNNWFYLLLAIGATAAYVFLLYRLLPLARQIGVRGLIDLFILAAVLSYMFAGINLYRIWSLLRQP